jgi:hypothetical protein
MRVEKYKKKKPTPIVMAAGNDFPNSEFQKTKMEQILFVANMGPDGLIDPTSSSFDKIVVAAPSGNKLVARSLKDPFGGTSGATPLVSSALVMAKSLLPDLSADRAKILLKASALPTWNSYEKPPLQNGYGTINAYGLLNLAKDIRDECVKKKETDENCFNKRVEQWKNRSIKVDQELLKKISVEFSCDSASPSVEANSTPSHCETRRVLLRSLRELAYLNPSVVPYWKTMACIHKQLGFRQNAVFYERLTAGGWPPALPAQISQTIAKKILLGVNNSPNPFPEIHALNFVEKIEDLEPVTLRPEVRKDALNVMAASFNTQVRALALKSILKEDLNGDDVSYAFRHLADSNSASAESLVTAMSHMNDSQLSCALELVTRPRLSKMNPGPRFPLLISAMDGLAPDDLLFSRLAILGKNNSGTSAQLNSIAVLAKWRRDLFWEIFSDHFAHPPVDQDLSKFLIDQMKEGGGESLLYLEKYASQIRLDEPARELIKEFLLSNSNRGRPIAFSDDEKKQAQKIIYLLEKSHVPASK